MNMRRVWGGKRRMAAMTRDIREQGEQLGLVGIAVEVFPQAAESIVHDVLGPFLVVHPAVCMHIELAEVLFEQVFKNEVFLRFAHSCRVCISCLAAKIAKMSECTLFPWYVILDALFPSYTLLYIRRRFRLGA